MRKLYFAFIGFLLTLSLSVFAFAQGAKSGQEGMESALSGVQNINELLNSPEKLDRYYNEVNDYYQGKIKRTIFNVIVEQMKTLVKDNPEFGVRLLKENTAAPSYTVISDVKTYGRQLNLYAWNSLRVHAFGNKTELPPDAKTKLAAISKEISDFEKGLEGNKKDQGIKRGEFYKNLKQTHAALIKDMVGAVFNSDPAITGLARSNDPDLVLYALDTVFKERLPRQGFPENTLSLLTSAIPRTADLLANTSVFPVATALNKRGVQVPLEPMNSTTYKFDSFKRPLHAVWKGIWLGECVGGGNDRPTPRRWATVAMNYVNNYAVEKNGGFIGFVQELGMMKKGNSRMVYATEFGTPNLKEDILVFDPTTKMPKKRKMLDVWIEQAPKNIRRVKSESRAINNASVIDTLEESQAWNNRRSLGNASEFEFVDQKLADFVIDSSHKHGMEPMYKYGDGIISDGTVPDANQLKIIKQTKWTEKKFKAFALNRSQSWSNVHDLISKNQAIVDRIDVDDFVRQFYLVNAGSDPIKVYNLVKYFYSKNPDIFQEYNSRLLASAKDNVEKLKLMETIAGYRSAHTLAFAKTLSWTGEEISRYIEYRESSLNDDTMTSLSKLALKNKLVAAYPAITKLGWRYFQGAADRKSLISAIQELGPEHREIAIQSAKNLFVDIKMATGPNQEAAVELAQKYGLMPELRAQASISRHGHEPLFNFTTFFGYAVSPKYIDQLLKSAVADKDVAFVKLAIASNVTDLRDDVDVKRAMANLVTYIIQSKSPELIELIADTRLATNWWRQVHSSYSRYLSPEATAYSKVAEAVFKNQGMDPKEIATQIASIDIVAAPKEVKTEVAESKPPTVKKPVAAAHPVHTQPPAAAPAPVAVAAAPALPEGNFSVDLRPLLTALFAAQDAGPVDGVQRRIHAALGEDHYPSRESVVMIREYLAATNAENLQHRTYHVLALFEIAAMTPNMPPELYRTSKALATRVLDMPEFRQYQPNYTELLRAQKVDPRAPMMCEAVFPRAG